MVTKTKKITTLAVLASLAYVSMYFLRIPIFAVPPLKLDPKDIFILIGGLIYGPIYAIILVFAVSFFEMISVSSTGFIGFIMNVLSSCAFVCPAVLIYQTKPSHKNALIGLLVGCFSMTLVMIVWNYFISPLYLNATREQVTGMLLTVFLPFNLLKSCINAFIFFLMYEPISIIIKKYKFSDIKQRSNVAILYSMLAVFLLATIALFILVLFGLI